MVKLKVALFTGTIVLNRDEFNVRQLYVVERLKHLVNQSDLDITILCPNKVDDELLNLNCRFNTYWVNRRRFRQLSVYISSFFKLLRLDLDLIHVYSEDFALLFMILQKIRKNKFKIIFEPMGLGVKELNIASRRNPKLKYLKGFRAWNERWFARNSSELVVYTKAMGEWFSNEYNVPIERITVAPYGHEHLKMEVETDKVEKLREELGLKGKEVVVYTGTLSELHGTPRLLEAARILGQKDPSIFFLIVGEGSLLEYLTEQAHADSMGNVHFTGKVPFEKVPLYIQLADLLVIPHTKSIKTDVDAPTKLFEYLAAGKPVVAFDLKIIREIADDLIHFAKPDDPEDLAKVIEECLKNPSDPEQLHEKYRDRILYKYSWSNSAKKVYETYKKVSMI